MFKIKTIKENAALKTANAAFSDQVTKLQERISDLDNANLKLANQALELKKEIQGNKNDIDARNQEIKELKSKLRPQTEADILLNALKAVGIIKEEKPKEFKHYQDNNALLEQHLNAVIQSYPQSGQRFLGGAFGGVF